MSAPKPPFRLKPDQFRDITRYRYGLRRTRPAGVPLLGPRKGRAKYVYDRWDRFDLWNAWQDRCHPAPRPAGVWTRVPVWDGWTPWDLRKELWKAKTKPPMKQPPPPPPPAGPDLSRGQSWIVMAQEPHKALMFPAYYGVMFTADRAYERPSAELLRELRRRGQRVRSWCDCHTTFPDEAKAMARSLGLDGWCGEGESAPAFQVALDAGADLVIVNLTALTDEQLQRIDGVHVQVVNELYLNQDEGRERWESWHDRPVSGRLVACYDAAGEAPGTGKRMPFSEYVRRGRFQPHRDSFYDPGATDADRALVT